jgi:succinate dehydrogenase / fumarate reductase, cytochrome b subunit
MSSQRSFFNRRIHSLLGVIPVGFFLLEHFLTNYEMVHGVEAFKKQVLWIWDLPFLLALEIFFIFLPLLYHGIYGLYIAFRAKNNINQFSTFRNFMFVLQRITGILTLIFVVWHVWETRVKIVAFSNLSHGAQLADELANQTIHMFNNEWIVVLYVIGIIAASFHFCNGMWAFLVSWGITVGPRAQRISTYVWMGAFVLVSYVGLRALFAFSAA